LVVAKGEGGLGVPDGEGAAVNVRNDMRGVLPVGTDLCGYELKYHSAARAR